MDSLKDSWCSLYQEWYISMHSTVLWTALKSMEYGMITKLNLHCNTQRCIFDFLPYISVKRSEEEQFRQVLLKWIFWSIKRAQISQIYKVNYINFIFLRHNGGVKWDRVLKYWLIQIWSEPSVLQSNVEQWGFVSTIHQKTTINFKHTPAKCIDCRNSEDFWMYAVSYID